MRTRALGEKGIGDDEVFGFLEVGAVASCAMPFLPARLGPVVV